MPRRAVAPMRCARASICTPLRAVQAAAGVRRETPPADRLRRWL
jgi:hypothetical protein